MFVCCIRQTCVVDELYIGTVVCFDVSALCVLCLFYVRHGSNVWGFLPSGHDVVCVM